MTAGCSRKPLRTAFVACGRADRLHLLLGGVLAPFAKMGGGIDWVIVARRRPALRAALALGGESGPGTRPALRSQGQAEGLEDLEIGGAGHERSAVVDAGLGDQSVGDVRFSTASEDGGAQAASVFPEAGACSRSGICKSSSVVFGVSLGSLRSSDRTTGGRHAWLSENARSTAATAAVLLRPK